MLDAESSDEAREATVADVKGKIETAGDLESTDSWGIRKMAYEIARRNEADYRYFRFTGESPLLDELDHSLKITEGVLRHRIFRVDPETPTTAPPISDRPEAVGADRAKGEEAPSRN